MMRVPGLVLCMLLIPSTSRRSTRIGDVFSGEQQENNMLEKLLPSGLGTALPRHLGLQRYGAALSHGVGPPRANVNYAAPSSRDPLRKITVDGLKEVLVDAPDHEEWRLGGADTHVSRIRPTARSRARDPAMLVPLGRGSVAARCNVARGDALAMQVAPADEGGLLAGAAWESLVAEANRAAEAIGLVVERCEFKGGTLRVLASGGGVDDLQELNNMLSDFIDRQADEVFEHFPPFLLEVSSPGLSSSLKDDRDFATFKGFPVTVTTTEPFKSKTRWEGTLVGRDEEVVTVNLKGRLQKIPRAIVDEVRLPEPKTEPGGK